MKKLSYSVIKIMLNFIPVILIGTAFSTLRNLILEVSPLNFVLVITSLYLLPLAVYRLLALMIPIKTGVSAIGKGFPPNGWLLALRCQLIYNVFPSLEKILILSPALYSSWLRLWGSKIGKNVFWTMDTQIIDRTHLNIGNNVFIGNKSYLSPHIGRKKENSYSILILPIVIEDNAFIGTHTVLGPGTKIKKDAEVKPMSNVIFNKNRNPLFGEIL